MSRTSTDRRGGPTFLLWMLLLAPLGACATQTPIHVIRADADWALKHGRVVEAAEGYSTIVGRHGGDWEAQYKFGVCCLQLDRLPEARRSLEIAASLRPRDERIGDALAEAMFRQNDRRHLFAYLKSQAETLQSVSAWQRLARYSMLIGDADSTRMALDMAIDLDDGNAVEPYLDAAEFAERMGDEGLAVRRLRQAYGIDPHDTRVSDRLLGLGEVPGPSIALPPGR